MKRIFTPAWLVALATTVAIGFALPVHAAPAVIAKFRSALLERNNLQLRILSTQVPTVMINEEPPRAGFEVERFATMICNVPLTARYRSQLLQNIKKTTFSRPADSYPPELQWGIELHERDGSLRSAIYLSTDWNNQDSTEAEIDGTNIEVSKQLLKWIEAEFPVSACQLHEP